MQHDEEETKEQAAGSTNPDQVFPDEVNEQLVSVIDRECDMASRFEEDWRFLACVKKYPTSISLKEVDGFTKRVYEGFKLTSTEMCRMKIH